MKILNAFAGIGGNRKLWDGEKHDIVAVESNPKTAEAYQTFNPKDTVIQANAFDFIEQNFDEFDFIWASPPCPTHSDIRRCGAKRGQYNPKMPDSRLYSLVEFLREFFGGDYAVENVANTWFDPWIRPQKSGRHYFWSNFEVPGHDSDQNISNGNVSEWQNKLGFDLSGFDLDKKKVLRNCVEPQLGLKVLQANNVRQQRLPEASQQ